MRKNKLKVVVALGVMTMAIAGCTKSSKVGVGDGTTKAGEPITTAKVTEATPDYEATSEKLDITGSAFLKYEEDINARVCPLEMDHFRNYKR